MADAYRIFADGPGSKKTMIERLWPELYNALARLDGQSQQRAIWCVIGSVEHVQERHPAVGRISRMGHPACKEHIDKLSRRPGGWPLPAEENQRRKDYP